MLRATASSAAAATATAATICCSCFAELQFSLAAFKLISARALHAKIFYVIKTWLPLQHGNAFFVAPSPPCFPLAKLPQNKRAGNNFCLAFFRQFFPLFSVRIVCVQNKAQTTKLAQQTNKLEGNNNSNKPYATHCGCFVCTQQIHIQYTQILIEVCLRVRMLVAFKTMSSLCCVGFLLPSFINFKVIIFWLQQICHTQFMPHHLATLVKKILLAVWLICVVNKSRFYCNACKTVACFVIDVISFEKRSN